MTVTEWPQQMPEALGLCILTPTSYRWGKLKSGMEYFELSFPNALPAIICPPRLPFIRKDLEALGIECEGKDPKEVLPQLVGRKIPCKIERTATLGRVYLETRLFPKTQTEE